MQNKDNLDNLRHSCAHLLAAAVLRLWPETKLTIGPAIENGFYYDFDFGDVKITDSYFPKIEKEMQRVIQSWPAFERIEVDADTAKKQFSHNPYKLELIHELAEKGEQLTLYKAGDYTDLCRGGHVETPRKELRHYKLLSLAGAYWRGDEKNKMLTRIYGTIFPTKPELEEHLARLEEAKKRDHRKIGQDLDLFTFSDLVGKGLPLWTPKGATIRRELERFIVDEELKRGYLHVYTPDIAKIDLYKTSGHYPYYKDTMYAPITIDDEEFMLRPMTCPHHFELYRARPRSYKELPIRYAELAKLYRYEKSGELTGLMRVRGFCLADAHIIATRDQAEEEIHKVLELIDYVASVFGMKPGTNYRYRLSLGDRSNEKKYYKDDASWDIAEHVLRRVLKDRNADYYEAADEAAFYGPKIDVQMKNIAGKEETAFTVQYDFVMPKRFHLSYIDQEGKEEEPIVIHRSSVGAIERTIAFLIEHYAGNFPLWLAPVQVILVPIADRHAEAAGRIAERLKLHHIRVEVDSRSESMQAKIRAATLQRVPFMGIIGDKEIERGPSVSIRSHDGKTIGTQTADQFVQFLKEKIEKKL